MAHAWQRVLIAHVQTWRPYTLWYPGLLGLAGAGLAGSGVDGWRLLAAWAAPTIGWAGGHYLSDYFDRELDAISKAHRPIPSGRLSTRAALVSGVVCLGLVGVLALITGLATSIVALLAAGGIVAYGWGLKARGYVGNLARGTLGALALLYGALAVAPTGSTVGWLLAPFLLAFWAHDTSSNLVGTLRDVAGDRAGGYRTVPVRYGNQAAVWSARVCYGVALVAATVGGAALIRAAPLPPGWWATYAALLGATAALGLGTFVLVRAQTATMDARTALRAHEFLVVERLGFAGATMALGLGPVRTLLPLTAVIALTWWTQRRMRSGYEFGSGAARWDGSSAVPQSVTGGSNQRDLG